MATDHQSPAARTSSLHVGVLLSHECAHQVAHALPVAAALARCRPDATVEVFYAQGAVEHEVHRLGGVLGIADHCRLTPLRGASRSARLLSRAVANAVPAERFSTLRRNRDRFRYLTGC